MGFFDGRTAPSAHGVAFELAVDFFRQLLDAKRLRDVGQMVAFEKNLSLLGDDIARNKQKPVEQREVVAGEGRNCPLKRR